MARVKARARAHANIALAKYWGKRDDARKLTAVPSFSLTLDGLVTTTEVEFRPEFAEDRVELDGTVAAPEVARRVVELLGRLRSLAGTELKARVTSKNDFPTAAGLASSASGFAALVVACDAALGLQLDAKRLSALARGASASAARSLFGGAVQLLAGAEHAEPVAPKEHFPLRLLVAITARGKKPVGSSEAMERTRRTSPYYPGWLSAAPTLFTRIKEAFLATDLPTLGAAMEQSTMLMHASMMGAEPSILYFEPSTLSVLSRVRKLRREGLEAYFTMDAGPQVKVLCEPQQAPALRDALSSIPGVVDVIDSGIGSEPVIEFLQRGD